MLLLRRRAPFEFGPPDGRLGAAIPATANVADVGHDGVCDCLTIATLGNPDTLTVTVHAARRTDPVSTDGVLVFDRLLALAYQ